MRRLLSLVILVPAGLCLTGGAATAAGGAPAPTTLVSAAPLDGGYQLASDADGAASVMWTETKTVGQAVDAVIDVRQQTARGGWGAVTQIGGVLATSEAQLAVAADGAAIVTWTWVAGGRGHRTVIDAVTRPSAFGAWSKAKQIWSSPDATGASIATAIDAAGQATIAWAGYDGANNVDPRILSAGVNAVHGTVGATSQVAGPGAGGLAPNLAVGADGAAVLSYQRQLSPVHAGATSARVAEMASYRSTGGAWSHPAQLGNFTAGSDGSDGLASETWAPSSPTSAVSSDGTPVVAWSARNTLEAATRVAASGKWTAAHALGGGVEGFGLEPGPNAGVVGVWSVGNGVFSADVGDSGTWSATERIATVKQGTAGPDLAPGASGAVLLSPIGGSGGSAVEFATRSTAGRWSAMRRVATGANGEIAAGPRGGATLVWESAGNGGNDTLYARSVR